jgi:organic radical activating enzyme
MEGYVANITTSFIEIPSEICSAVYLTGCKFKCPECQNERLQELEYGKLMKVDKVVKMINNNCLSKWVCFLGGEPFYQHEFLLELCKKIVRPIGIYTGNNYEYVSNNYKEIIGLPNILFLKTGRFKIEMMDVEEFPITKNQEVYLKKNGEWELCESRTIDGVSLEIGKYREHNRTL